jgi:hypothetical protein
MDWKSDIIIQSFNGIIRDARVLSSEELEVKYAGFKESFSKLYDVAIDAVVTGKVQEAYEMLKMMLKAREGMQEGRTNKLTTDMFVGNQLGKKYIYPKTNTPSTEDYKQAFDTIKEKIKQNEEDDRKKELEQQQEQQEQQEQQQNVSDYTYNLVPKSD